MQQDFTTSYSSLQAIQCCLLDQLQEYRRTPKIEKSLKRGGGDACARKKGTEHLITIPSISSEYPIHENIKKRETDAQSQSTYTSLHS